MTVSLAIWQGLGTVREAVDAYLQECASRNLSRSTQEMSRDILLRLCKEVGNLPPDHMPQETLTAFLQSLPVSPASRLRYYTVLQGFGRFLSRQGFPNPAHSLPRPKAPKPVIEPVPLQDVEAMLEACTNSPLGRRNKLLLLLLIDCGLRASELSALKVKDIDAGERIILIRQGKGGKPRRVPYGQAVTDALQEWMRERKAVQTEYLLINQYGLPLDRHSIRGIVCSLARKAGVTSKVSPHKLRHTCAVSYLRAGGDVFTLQRLLGHSDLSMTRRYTEVTDADLQERHKLYSPADRLRLPQEKRRKVL